MLFIPDDVPSNDTNEDELLYFARVSNHYLRLVKSHSLDLEDCRHDIRYPIIADSGANFHMFKHPEFFTSLDPIQGHVILGDGHTKVPIQGIGTVHCIIDGHSLLIPDVRFVPQLSDSVYSLLQHIKQPGHGLHSSFEKGLHVTFPDFQTKAVVGKDDIFLNFLPASNYSSIHPDYGDSSILSSSNNLDTICRHTTDVTSTNTIGQKELNNLMKSLRQYYASVKTKRQLSLNVPAGFRQASNLQTMFQTFTPPRKSKSAEDHLLSQPSDTVVGFSSAIHSSDTTATTTCDLDVTPTPISDTSSSTNVPILRCVDKVSTSLPSRLTFTEDFIRASVGFRRIDSIKQHLKHLYQDTVDLDSMPPDAILDLGECATLKKTPRNTLPVPRPSHFGDVIHMDIVFGPDISVGNIHYGMIFTDRYSRMTYLYPLQNLTSDVRKQLESFFAHLGFSPKRLISDFDTKLIGGQAREYLNSISLYSPLNIAYPGSSSL